MSFGNQCFRKKCIKNNKVKDNRMTKPFKVKYKFKLINSIRLYERLTN